MRSVSPKLIPFLLAALLLVPAIALSQDTEPVDASAPGPNAQREAEAAALAEAALAENPSAKASAESVSAPDSQHLNALDLFFKGGVLMYPIAFISFLVVAFSIERALALRRRRIIPPALVRELRQLAKAPGGFDARAAYRLCSERESVLSRVLRAALLKLGRPSAEVHQAVNDACQREATRLYKNVRPITLAITIAPLLGLLGTVQGMIQAFFITSVAPLGVNKAQSLAEGIYTALVTTFAGLSVAIPAAILAHYFEGRIQTLIGDIEELLGEWLPQLDRFEGKVRAGRGELTAFAVTEPPRVPPEAPAPRLHKATTD